MNRKTRSISVRLAAFTSVLVGGALVLFVMSDRSVVAQEQEPPSKPFRDPRAERILKEMSDYLRASRAFTLRTETTFEEVLPSGQKLQFSAVNDVAVKRPNRMRADRQGDLRSIRFYYDGKRITIYSLNENVYSSFAAPPTIDSALDVAMKKYGLSAPLADLVYANPHAILMEKVEGAMYVGLHTAAGVRCHHLAFTQKNLDWQIWIEDGEQLVPRRVVITYKNDPGVPQFTAVISKWNFSARLPERLFTFEPPDVADQIEIEEVKKADE
jgi:hypothetical protein